MDIVEVYQDEAGEYRWRRIAPNNRIIADSGEGYVDRNNAREAAERVNEGVEIVQVHGE